MRYQLTLPIDWESKQSVDQWCHGNLQGKWECITYEQGYGAVPPTWRFEDGEDYMLFLMRWV